MKFDHLDAVVREGLADKIGGLLTKARLIGPERFAAENERRIERGQSALNANQLLATLSGPLEVVDRWEGRLESFEESLGLHRALSYGEPTTLHQAWAERAAALTARELLRTAEVDEDDIFWTLARLGFHPTVMVAPTVMDEEGDDSAMLIAIHTDSSSGTCRLSLAGDGRLLRHGESIFSAAGECLVDTMTWSFAKGNPKKVHQSLSALLTNARVTKVFHYDVETMCLVLVFGMPYRRSNDNLPTTVEDGDLSGRIMAWAPASMIHEAVKDHDLRPMAEALQNARFPLLVAGFPAPMVAPLRELLGG